MRRFEECLTIPKKQLTKEQLKKTTAYQAMERIAMLYENPRSRAAGYQPETRSARH